MNGLAPQTTGPDALETAFLVALWRTPGDAERRTFESMLASGATLAQLAERLLVSAEFRLLQEAAALGHDRIRPTPLVRAALDRLGDDGTFLAAAYRVLFGREPDPGGHAFYAAQLAAGTPRVAVLRDLLGSGELRDRQVRAGIRLDLVPRDEQLCELANPAKWDNPEWMALLRSLAAIPPDKASMHRKGYELTQLAFALTRLGYLRDDVDIVSVGAGHEPILYWLANRVRRVVATDLYDGAWQTRGAMEGDARVLEDPAQFAPFEYRRDRLSFMRMDGRRLDFPDTSFDVAYSMSSIEHFGGLAAAREALAEMARVVRPGGLVVLATEFILDGPPYEEAFTAEAFSALIEHPRLELLQPVDTNVYRRYRVSPVDLVATPWVTPHMTVRIGETVFTSVFVVLART